MNKIEENPALNDTAKVIKMIKLVPATKIKSTEGAIIPKEVLYMSKIQPAMPYTKEESAPGLFSYFFVGIVVVLLIIFVRKIFLARNKGSFK